MDKTQEIQLTMNSLFHALASALRELSARGASESDAYIVGMKELEQAREKLGIKRF